MGASSGPTLPFRCSASRYAALSERRRLAGARDRRVRQPRLDPARLLVPLTDGRQITGLHDRRPAVVYRGLRHGAAARGRCAETAGSPADTPRCRGAPRTRARGTGHYNCSTDGVLRGPHFARYSPAGFLRRFGDLGIPARSQADDDVMSLLTGDDLRIETTPVVALPAGRSVDFDGNRGASRSWTGGLAKPCRWEMNCRLKTFQRPTQRDAGLTGAPRDFSIVAAC